MPGGKDEFDFQGSGRGDGSRQEALFIRSPKKAYHALVGDANRMKLAE
jgi:hypothetical protein